MSYFIICSQYAATEEDNVICVLTEKRQNFNNILSWICETRYSFIQSVHTISKFKLNVGEISYGICMRCDT